LSSEKRQAIKSPSGEQEGSRLSPPERTFDGSTALFEFAGPDFVGAFLAGVEEQTLAVGIEGGVPGILTV